MLISILTDNKPGVNTSAEHGLSYLVKRDGKGLLFYTGGTNSFRRCIPLFVKIINMLVGLMAGVILLRIVL